MNEEQEKKIGTVVFAKSSLTDVYEAYSEDDTDREDGISVRLKDGILKVGSSFPEDDAFTWEEAAEILHRRFSEAAESHEWGKRLREQFAELPSA